MTTHIMPYDIKLWVEQYHCLADGLKWSVCPYLIYKNDWGYSIAGELSILMLNSKWS